jgi:hypothetical protein
MSMSEGIEVFAGRDTLKNKCKNGHLSPVFARFCNVCGGPTDRKHGYRDWANLTIDMQQRWRHLADWNELSDTIYFSYYDERLLQINQRGHALFAESVLQNDEAPRNVRSFHLGGGVQDIEQVLTLDDEIYLLAEGSIWNLRWRDLIDYNLEIFKLPAPGISFVKMLEYEGKIHAIGADRLYEVTGNKAFQPLFSLSDHERILDIETKGNRLCVISHDEARSKADEAAVNVRTQHRADPARLCEPITVKDQLKLDHKCLSACGKDYYAFSLGGQCVRIGKYSSLQANSTMMYHMNTGYEIEKLFFLRDHLYVYGQNQLRTWDCAAFTNNPTGTLNGVNLASMNPCTSEIDHRVLLPVQQNQGDFIAVHNAQLRQHSISWGFSEKLVAMDILDNHIFALFRADSKLRLYLG